MHSELRDPSLIRMPPAARCKQISAAMRHLQFDLLHANDARVSVGYCADSSAVSHADGTRFSAAPSSWRRP